VHLLFCAPFPSQPHCSSLYQASIFIAVEITLIYQDAQQSQPNLVDLTNVQNVEKDALFSRTDPLALVSDTPTGLIITKSLLSISLLFNSLTALAALLGKGWIRRYTRVTSRGNIADRGKERFDKIMGLQKWRFHLVVGSLSTSLQLAFLFFGAAVATYLWGLNHSVAGVVYISFHVFFYVCPTTMATVWRDCPYQTPLSTLLLNILSWVKKSTGETNIITPVGNATQNPTGQETPINDGPISLSNPAFWRCNPLFLPPLPSDIRATVGFWMLDSSTKFLVTSAVAAAFQEFQWPSHYHSTAALVQFRDMYMACLRVPEFDEFTRLTALQSAAAYYTLYHIQLIWSVSKGLTPPNSCSDLFHLHKERWGVGSVFEYLLHTNVRLEPVTSAKFLSYIAPYWFRSNSGLRIEAHLQILKELINMLEESKALNSATLTDCVLCVGAIMDFPLHSEDLVRVDKRYGPLSLHTVKLTGDSDYFSLALEMVVNHIHDMALHQSRQSHRSNRRRHAKGVLGVLLNLINKASHPLDGPWIYGLLMDAVTSGMDDDIFIMFLEISTCRRKEKAATAGARARSSLECVYVHRSATDSQPPGETALPEPLLDANDLLNKISQIIKIRSKDGGWQDGAVYAGLVAIAGIPRLRSSFPGFGLLETLSRAMGTRENQPLRVRKAAYDVILAARDGWLRSPRLRGTLEELDLPEKLCSVVTETGRPYDKRSFLMMMRVLSENEDWHSYLMGAMRIWLPFRDVGPEHTLSILRNVSELPIPEDYAGPNTSLDEYLGNLVRSEWTGIVNSNAADLSANRLRLLEEVTRQFTLLLSPKGGL